MSQRGNSGHHPEVTIQLNYYFYFIFTKKQGPSPKVQQPPWAALCDLMLLPTGCGATRSSWALSLLWVLDYYRSGWCGAPHSPVHCAGGAVLCPGGPRDPSPTAWVGRAVVLHCFQVLVSAAAGERGCEHSLALALHLEMPVKLTGAMDTVTA